MKSAVHDRRFLPDVFHDVDLAAIGPACGIDIVAQHPKGRPQALTVRYLESCFKSSIGLAELIPGEQSGRSVVALLPIKTGESFLESFDYQHPTFEIRVCSPIRIS